MWGMELYKYYESGTIFESIHTNAGILVAFFIWVAILGFAMYLLIKKIKERRKALRLKATTPPQNLRIEDIKDSWWRINESSQFYLVVKYGGRMLISESFLPFDECLVGGMVQVYIDPLDPEEYWIDVDSVLLADHPTTDLPDFDETSFE